MNVIDKAAYSLAKRNEISISGVITGKISTPDDFSWKTSPIEGMITRMVDGSVVVAFDIDQYKQSTGIEYFVDQSLGNDSNDGLTPATALLKVSTAYGKSDVGKITIMSANLYYDKFMNGTSINKSVTISGYVGGRCVVSNAITGGYTKTGGQNYVYQKTVSNVAKVIDISRSDAYGDMFGLVYVASIALCDTTVDSFYTDGTTLYVHTLGGGSPSTKHLAVRTTPLATSIVLSESKTIFFENIDFLTGVSISGVGVVAFKNCTFQYGIVTDSVTVSDSTITVIFENCIVSKSLADGINYASGAKGIELSCIGRNNGDGTNDTQNGSTSHGGAKVIRISGEYYNNHGPNVIDVQNDTESWNINCYAHDSKSTNPVSSNDFATNAEGAAKMFLDHCVGKVSAFSLYAYVNSTVYVKDCNFYTVRNEGTISTY